MKVPYGDGSGASGFAEIPAFGSPPKQIRIVKARDTLPNRGENLLKTIEHLETQLGRLTKMARDMRAEVLSLTASE